jgi:hypothetical protein
MQPGPVAQPVYVMVPRRRRRFGLAPFTPAKQRSLATAGMLLGGFLVFFVVASIILVVASFILSHVALPPPGGPTTPTPQPSATSLAGDAAGQQGRLAHAWAMSQIGCAITRLSA